MRFYSRISPKLPSFSSRFFRSPAGSRRCKKISEVVGVVHRGFFFAKSFLQYRHRDRRLVGKSWIVALCCLPLFACGVALAQEKSGKSTKEQKAPYAKFNRSPYDVDLGLDIGVTLGSIVVLGLPDIIGDEIVRPWCGLDCDKDNINSLDRHVVGKTSHLADVYSDVGVAVNYALPFVLNTVDVLISDTEDGWSAWAKDSLVLAETLSLTLASTNLIKYVVRRPRPFVYSGDVDDKTRLAPDSSLSFPSGHTASSFAMATAYSFTFMHRHPHSPLRIPVWLGTLGLAAAVGVARTESGEHFYTDVIAGAVLGTGLGLLIPYLHLRESDSSQAQDDDCAIEIRPMITSSGGGVVISFY